MDYTNVSGYLIHYSDEVRHLLHRLQMDPEGLIDATRVLASAYESGNEVFIAGNGGCAAIANHMATDHTKHMAAEKEYYTNIRSLCGNEALMTAVANDIGYDAVFSWQLERYAMAKDILIVFSASGNSANIVRAIQAATEMGMKTIAITGFDGGKAATLAEVNVHIHSNNYGVVEDVMSIIQHVIAQYIRQRRMSVEAIQSAVF
jgi:D-sedoheptulose 7-phosphate isomerase/D-glycero-D-manno-heptose 1,7-bisphosphate phosphatase